MKRPILLLAILAGLILLGWFFARATGSKGERTAWGALDGGHGARAPLEPRLVLANPASEGVSRSALEHAADMAGNPRVDAPAALAARLTVRVTWKTDGGPVVDAPVELLLGPGSAATTHRREARTDEAGFVRWNDLPAGRANVHCLLGGWVEDTLHAARETALELALDEGLTLDGFVADERGVGVAEAFLFLSSEGHPGVGGFVARTLSDGTFHLRTATTYPLVGAVAAGYEPSEHVRLEAGGPARREVRLTLKRGGAAVFGAVTTANGEPVPNARLVFSTGARRMNDRPDGSWAGRAVRFLATSDATGAYELPAIQTGDVRAVCLAFGRAAVLRPLTLAPGERRRVDFALEAEAAVAGTIRSAAMEPLTEAWVQIVPESFRSGELEEVHRFTALTDAAGRFHVGGLPPGPVRARVDTRGDGSHEERLELRIGATTRWDVALTNGHALSGVLVDANGAPLAGWTVRALSARTIRDTWGGSATVDERGGFAIHGLLDATHRVTALPPEEASYPALVVDDVRPPRTDLVLTVPAASRPTAHVRGVVRDARGNPLDHASLHLQRRGIVGGTLRHAAADGRFAVGPVPGGTYALEIEAAGLPTWRRDDLELRADETLDLGIVTLPEGGRIEVALERVPGNDVHVTIRRDGRWLQTLELDGGRGRSRPLMPGTHEVSIAGALVREHRIEVAVRDGEVTSCTLPVEPGRYFVVVFTAPLGDDGPQAIECVLQHANGSVVERRTSRMHPHVFARDLAEEERTGRHPIGTEAFSLPFETYVVRASFGSWSAERTITLDLQSEPPDVEFTIPGK